MTSKKLDELVSGFAVRAARELQRDPRARAVVAGAVLGVGTVAVSNAPTPRAALARSHGMLDLVHSILHGDDEGDE